MQCISVYNSYTHRNFSTSKDREIPKILTKKTSGWYPLALVFVIAAKE